MSIHANYVAPQIADTLAAVDHILATLRDQSPSLSLVDDSGFEAPDADMGHSVDDDEQADVLEARETAWREGRR